MSTYVFCKPLYVMLKPVGLYATWHAIIVIIWRSPNYVNNPKHVMSDELLKSSLKNISIRKQCLKYCSPGMAEKPDAPLASTKKPWNCKEIRQRTDD